MTLWIVNMNKKAGVKNGRRLRDRRGEVLFVDLRTWNENIETYTYEKGKRKQKVVLTSEQIAEVKNIYSSWQEENGAYEDIPELCAYVSLDSEDGMKAKGYSLAPSKYVKFIDHDLDIDYDAEMSRIQSEMSMILAAEKKSQRILEEAFEGIGYGIR